MPQAIKLELAITLLYLFMTNHHKLTTIGSSDKHHKYAQQSNDHHRGVEAEEDDEHIFELAPANIFDTTYRGELVPKGFDAVKIKLEGGLKADLSWKQEREAALVYLSQGLRILWEMDLGLPDLPQTLANRTQFLSLSLSLEHFCNTLWKEFRKESVGLCLYRGSLDFSKNHRWNEEQINNLQDWAKEQFDSIDSLAKETGIALVNDQSLTNDLLSQSDMGKKILQYYCRDAIAEYLNLLATGVNNLLPLFVFLDTTEIHDPFLIVHLLAKDCFPRFHIGVKKNAEMLLLGRGMSWEGSSLEMGMIGRTLSENRCIERANFGFCIPKRLGYKPSLTKTLSNALKELANRNVPLRIISEVELTTEWDGLDYLIVDGEKVDFQFKRKLQGFCAAGGTVISIEKILGLPQELSFKDFIKNELVCPLT